MPTKVIEYMAHGIPVITTPLPLARVIVTRAGCGIVVPFGDADATAAALIELAADPERRAALGRAGHRYARERHDWNAVGHEFVSHVRALARRGRPGEDELSTPASALNADALVNPSPSGPEDLRPTTGEPSCSTTESPSSASATSAYRPAPR
jgi:hypothetical protein